jgi:hypothetical protein
MSNRVYPFAVPPPEMLSVDYHNVISANNALMHQLYPGGGYPAYYPITTPSPTAASAAAHTPAYLRAIPANYIMNGHPHTQPSSKNDHSNGGVPQQQQQQQQQQHHPAYPTGYNMNYFHPGLIGQNGDSNINNNHNGNSGGPVSFRNDSTSLSFPWNHPNAMMHSLPPHPPINSNNQQHQQQQHQGGPYQSINQEWNPLSGLISGESMDNIAKLLYNSSQSFDNFQALLQSSSINLAGKKIVGGTGEASPGGTTDQTHPNSSDTKENEHENEPSSSSNQQQQQQQHQQFPMKRYHDDEVGYPLEDAVTATNSPHTNKQIGSPAGRNNIQQVAVTENTQNQETLPSPSKSPPPVLIPSASKVILVFVYLYFLLFIIVYFLLEFIRCCSSNNRDTIIWK